MASSEPTPPKGACNKAKSHGQRAVAQEIGPQDQVQHLIAFASTILNISVKSEKKLPVVSSRSNRRVSRILDAIANISISQARGETVAVSVQLTNTDIQLILASNNTLPVSTLRQGFLVYIGISKPCCFSCFQCIQAINNVVGRRFRTKIKANPKLCYPWKFPILPHANFVAEQMRDTMCIALGKNFKGFGPQEANLSRP